MTTIQAFLIRCDGYRHGRGISQSYLSRLLFDDGKVIDGLRSSACDVTTRRLQRAEVLLGEFERALSVAISSSDAVSVSAASHPPPAA
ncbi:MAG TPA: hypothetical protein PKX06_08860 [Phenylobacterium sp.]|nr:hypothetical protein [Phenylobacterium sp.]